MTTKDMKLKIVEISGSAAGHNFTDYLLADEGASEAAVMIGKEGVYCQLADRPTAEIFRNAVNGWPALIDALQKIVAEAPAEAPEEEDYDDTESAYSNGMDVAMWNAGQIAIQALIAVGMAPEPADDGRDVYDGWSGEDSDAAYTEGWNIFERSGDGTLRILADDQAGLIGSDYEALELVLKKAREGSDLHRRAIAINYPDPFECAARLKGWDQGGDNGDVIYDTAVFESWKAAVSWSGEDATDEAEANSATYSTWEECCRGENIEVPDAAEVTVQ